MERIEISPSGPVNFDLTVPGSKSLTNRALICAALADGPSTLTNASLSDDSRYLMEALNKLGIKVEADHEGGIRVHGQGGRLPSAQGDFFLGNAGTAMRFLTSFLCLGHGRYDVDGDERMKERPIGGLVGALAQLGARIRYARRDGFPPLSIEAEGIRGGSAIVAGDTSSQFISSVLMAAPYAKEGVSLEASGEVTSKSYIDMTIHLMNDFGVPVDREDHRRFTIRAGRFYVARTYAIECDAAGANYFLAMAAATRGRTIVRGIGWGSRQGEVGFVRILAQMGCTVLLERDFIEVRGGELRGVDVDMNDAPDSVQTLAVLALAASGPTRIRNIRNLRIKETDRIAALATELRKLGAQVVEKEDAIEVQPGPRRPAEIETYRDHRMAMSFSIAGMMGPAVTILDPDCVSKSFPGFFELLRIQRSS